MAQRVTVELEDDLDGGPAEETLRFGLGGSEYEIDLSKKNASAFRRQIAPYIEHARKAGSRQRRRARRPLRPELAAPLGVWPSSQQTQCAGGRAGWRCCT
jgi:Lsr2